MGEPSSSIPSARPFVLHVHHSTSNRCDSLQQQGNHPVDYSLQINEAGPFGPEACARGAHGQPNQDNASMRSIPLGSTLRWIRCRPGILFVVFVGFKGLDMTVHCRKDCARVQYPEASAVIRVHRSRYSAVRVEGVSISTEIVECGVQHHRSPRQPTLITPRLEAHTPNDDHGEQGKLATKPRSET